MVWPRFSNCFKEPPITLLLSLLSEVNLGLSQPLGVTMSFEGQDPNNPKPFGQ